MPWRDPHVGRVVLGATVEEACAGPRQLQEALGTFSGEAPPAWRLWGQASAISHKLPWQGRPLHGAGGLRGCPPACLRRRRRRQPSWPSPPAPAPTLQGGSTR